MKITKFGHSCLLIVVDKTQILVDPGAWNEIPELKNINVLLITHEHPDHLNLDYVKTLVLNNPNLTIYTNNAVGKILTENRIGFEVSTDQFNIGQVKIRSFISPHALIYPGLPQVDNTSFFIQDRFLITGDLLKSYALNVEILAVPIAAPWLTLADAIDFVKVVKPKIAFPVHDGALKYLGSTHTAPKQILEKVGINFQVLELGQEIDL